MKTIWCLIFWISFVQYASGQMAESISKDDIAVIKHLILARQVEITLGVDWKRNVRLGDKSARLLSKVYSPDELLSPEKIKLFVPILTTSFEATGWILAPADKCPVDTFKLFDRISERVDDPSVLEIVKEGRSFITKQTGEVKDCAVVNTAR